MRANRTHVCLLSMFGILSSSFALLPHEQMTETNANLGFAQEMMRSMEIMDKDMTAAPMTGDPDHDFSAMLIHQHHGAVDMAKAVLLYGKDPALKRLAQEIIVTQQQEIEVMRVRLAAAEAIGPVGPQYSKTASIGAVKVSSRDRVYTADQT